MSERILSSLDVAATAEAIAAVQLPSGMIPWFEGGHADPWNHTEAVMALTVAGRRAEAELGFAWLEGTQLPDGSWFTYHTAAGVEDRRRDSNVSSYVAVGTWHHWTVTGDRGFLEAAWPMVSRAVGFALSLQQPGGEVLWCHEPDGSRGRFALLAGCSSLYLSIRCALALAAALGHDQPLWELAAARLGAAIVHRPGRFEPKDRWSMDWYYPVLCGALRGEPAARRLAERWSEFVLDGLGVRCVADQPWVTGAETAEFVLALDATGRRAQARRLLAEVQYLRHPDGSYWTGCVHPEAVHFPGGERSTYTAAAVVLAADAIDGNSPAGGLFRGEGLPVLDLDAAGSGQRPEPARRSTRRLPVASSSTKAPDARARQ